MKIFKVNELFDSTQTYDYKLESSKSISNMWSYNREEYTYSFISNDGTKYYVELAYYDAVAL